MQIKVKPILIGLLCLSVGLQSAIGQIDQRIHTLLKTYHDFHQLDGAVLVAKGDSVIYRGAWGHASQSYVIPNSAETKFRIASITKIFTATLVLQLVDEKQIQLDDPIGKYLDSLRPELGAQVTIKQLLTHSSGLEREYFPKDPDPSTEFSTLDLVQAVNTHSQLLFSPGDSLSYSNAGYVLLAGLIEAVTNMHYRDALQDRILEPLGMRHTGYETSTKEIIPQLATGYRLRLGTYLHADPVGVEWTRGNGGIYSTLGDLLRFDQALKSSKLISQEALELMLTRSFDYSSFAMQWQVFEQMEGFPDTGHRYAVARGASPMGFRTQWITEIEGDFTVIILANLDFCPRREIAGKIFQLLYDQEITLPEKPLSLETLELLHEKGKAAVTTLLKERLTTSPNEVALTINEFIELGFHQIRAQTLKPALDLFIISDELFPNNPGILSSLSYAYYQVGDMKKAKLLAEQVLELSPGNKDALEIMSLLKFAGG